MTKQSLMAGVTTLLVAMVVGTGVGEPEAYASPLMANTSIYRIYFTSLIDDPEEPCYRASSIASPDLKRAWPRSKGSTWALRSHWLTGSIERAAASWSRELSRVWGFALSSTGWPRSIGSAAQCVMANTVW